MSAVGRQTPVEDKKMNIVAIIPARGGSKRIPGKNIKRFAGKPIIAYSIVAAQNCGLFSRIIVSTDSKEIAGVAEEFGSEVPFIRPAELSDDFTDTSAVILHTLNWLEKNDALPDYFCCLYATAPFIQVKSIKEGFGRLKQEDATSAFSVASFAYPILRALKTDDNGCLKMFWPEHKTTRSNDLPEAYHDAGQFYWGHTRRFLKERTFFSSKAIPVVMPRHLVQDIDTPEDWEVAEYMYKALKFGKENRGCGK
jgi:pseudaminic acid cytidylyltransferase